MIIGIDLGTSTSEAAYVNENNEVIVIPNTKDELITPSVVYLKPNGRAIVGSEAKEYMFTRPDCTFIEIKRKFGTEEKLTAHNKTYLPEDIQSRIIKYLVDCAEEHIGKEVEGAVITVPAYFTDVQRKQTIRAGELAGIKVERVINEPTAAALDYGLKNLAECEHILVYDFGGGTLDVTVLELFEGVIDVKSSCGNNRLGGKDFDEALMKHIAGKHYKAILSDPKAQMKLKHAAVDVKTSLSKEESANVRLPLIIKDISIDLTVTRTDFETIIKPMVDSTGEQLDTALTDAGLSASDLKKVILVGGTTHIPLVRKFVEEKLGIKTDKEGGYGPELMVVRGAAVQAAIIDGIITEDKSVILADICPFTLGVKVVTREGLRVDALIQKNVTIPYEYSRVYSAMYEYQSGILFEIYQGESKFSQENTRIGQLRLDKLPQRQNEKARAEVIFSYDINGILNIKARSLGNDSTAATVIDINNNDLPTRPPVKLSEWEKAKDAAKYRPVLRKVHKIISPYIDTAFFVEADLFITLDHCDELKACLLLGDEKGAEENAEAIKEFLEEWDEKDDKIKNFFDFFNKNGD